MGPQPTPSNNVDNSEWAHRSSNVDIPEWAHSHRRIPASITLNGPTEAAISTSTNGPTADTEAAMSIYLNGSIATQNTGVDNLEWAHRTGDVDMLEWAHSHRRVVLSIILNWPTEPEMSICLNGPRASAEWCWRLS